MPTGVIPVNANECVKARDVDYHQRGGLRWAASQRVALEFHSPTLAPFLTYVLPRMSLLKAALEQRCGSGVSGGAGHLLACLYRQRGAEGVEPVA